MFCNRRPHSRGKPTSEASRHTDQTPQAFLGATSGEPSLRDAVASLALAGRALVLVLAGRTDASTHLGGATGGVVGAVCVVRHRRRGVREARTAGALPDRHWLLAVHGALGHDARHRLVVGCSYRSGTARRRRAGRGVAERDLADPAQAQKTGRACRRGRAERPGGACSGTDGGRARSGSWGEGRLHQRGRPDHGADHGAAPQQGTSSHPLRSGRS